MRGFLAILLVALFTSPAIAQAAPDAEAWLFIPQQWRARIDPVTSRPLPSDCNASRDFAFFDGMAGSPPGADPAVFVLACQPALPAFDAQRAGQTGTLHWLSAASLEELASLPDTDWWAGDILVADGAPRLFMPRTETSVGLGGDVRATPGGWRSDGFTVLLEDGVAFEIARIRRDRDVCVAPYAPCASQLVILNTRTGAERLMDIVAPADAGLRRYGDRQVVFSVPATAPGERGVMDVVIVDADTMSVAWRGQPSLAPPPRTGRLCVTRLGAMHSASGSEAALPSPRVSLDGEAFDVPGATSCAIAGGGQYLLIAGRRLLHLYRIKAAVER